VQIEHHPKGERPTITLRQAVLADREREDALAGFIDRSRFRRWRWKRSQNRAARVEAD
jgi:hypothetical protein